MNFRYEKNKNRKHLSVSTLQTLHGCTHIIQLLITYLKIKLTGNPIFLLAKSVVNTLPPEGSVWSSPCCAGLETWKKSQSTWNNLIDTVDWAT